MNNAQAFRWIRVAGLLSLIPLVLASGPLTGYIAGHYLIQWFRFPHYTAVLCAIIGFIAGVRETVRIIRAAMRSGNAE